MAHHETHTLDMKDLPLLVIDHPLGGAARAGQQKAARAVAQLGTRLGR